MKSYKQLLNEWAQQTDFLHEMSSDELSGLHALLLDMYRDLAEVCKEHNICLMLCGGSCLGAIRHNGYIPWDDDLDVLVPRKDYNRLMRLLEEGALGSNYEVRTLLGEKECSAAFSKIYRKGTVFSHDGRYPVGVFLDIFPLDGTSENRIVRKLTGYLANIIRLCGNCVAENHERDEEYMKAISESSELLKMTKRRALLGKMLSFVHHQTWNKWFEKIVANDRESTYLAIPTGRKLYGGEILPREVYLPASKAIFEGLEVYVPRDVDSYLTNLYGKDYMELPPVEKRERHFVRSIKL